MSLREKVKRFSDERWNVGFVKNSLDSVMRGEEIKVDWVKHHCRQSWFADPFILDVTDDEIVLLVEEFYKPIYRGRISKLTIDRASNRLKSIDVVLQLPTHLSFPVIIRRETEFGKKLDALYGQSQGSYVYLMPENGASGKLSVYRYWQSDDRIERQGSVLDEAVEDAIPVTIDGETFLFCTPRSNPNGNELDVYRWEAPVFTPYAHYRFQENVARMAGMFFTYNSELIRPTQECNVQYGHAVTLQKTLSDSSFSFKELRRMYSVNPKFNIGSHTFNMYKDVIVTDSLGYDNMWFRRLLHLLHII